MLRGPLPFNIPEHFPDFSLGQILRCLCAPINGQKGRRKAAVATLLWSCNSLLHCQVLWGGGGLWCIYVSQMPSMQQWRSPTLFPVEAMREAAGLKELSLDFNCRAGCKWFHLLGKLTFSFSLPSFCASDYMLFFSGTAAFRAKLLVPFTDYC